MRAVRRIAGAGRALAVLLALVAAGAVHAQETPPAPEAPPAEAPPAETPPADAPPVAPAQDATQPPAAEPVQEVPPAAAPEPVAPPQPEQVTVRRLSDVVAVRQGPQAAERVLYYFNPNVLLAQGDHVEQGSGGQSELTLPGGANLQLHASAHVELSLLSPESDVVRFPMLTRLDALALERPLTVILPGGTQVRLQNTTLRVEVEPGRMRVRNTGSTPLTLTGDLRMQPGTSTDQPLGQLELQRGEEVLIPLFRVSAAEVGTVTDLWGTLTVRHQRGLKLAPEGELLRLQRDAGNVEAAGDAPAPQTEEAIVGGVTTRWLPGSALSIENPRHTDAPSALSTPMDEATLQRLTTLGYIEETGAPAAAEPAPADAPAPAEPPAPVPADAPGSGAPAPGENPPSPPPGDEPKLPSGKESRS